MSFLCHPEDVIDEGFLEILRFAQDDTIMKTSSQAWIFRATIFLSAFLLFSIQPMIAKILLPWFGGSAGVWTICLLFFTTSLLLGYCYAYVIARWTSQRQLAIHSIFTLVVICVLIGLWYAWGSPLTPSVFFKPDPTTPVSSLLFLLAITIGGPYLLLSATTPLIQSWFHTTFKKTPYTLYSVSNIGSLGALLLYPTLIEPSLSVLIQGRVWATVFFVFAVLLLVSGRIFLKARPMPALASINRSVKASEALGLRSIVKKEAVLWTILSAIPAFFLVSVTTTFTQGVASVPFFWVIPLACYLLTFIIVFADFDMPSPVLAGLLIATAFFSLMILRDPFGSSIVILAGVLIPMFFAVCLYFHQWLFEKRPEPSRLTIYFVWISFGGAMGTMISSLLVPLMFVRSIELAIAIICVLLFTIFRFFISFEILAHRPRIRITLAILLVFSLGLIGYKLIMVERDGVLFEARNFYSILSVTQENRLGEDIRLLKNGRIIHGLQFQREEKQFTPTTYYVEKSGVGQQIRFMQQQKPSQNLGLIGLGSGALAGYCRPGDTYRFFEIDPDVVAMAKNLFSFLGQCDGSDVVLGDARLSLEQELRDNADGYDLLVVDAFTDDSIPVHLLTKEAFALYLDRLDQDGVLAIHISNRFLDLAPVVKASAEVLGLYGMIVSDIREDNTNYEGSRWILLARDRSLLKETFNESAMALEDEPRSILWTDAFSNLLSVVSF